MVIHIFFFEHEGCSRILSPPAHPRVESKRQKPRNVFYFNSIDLGKGSNISVLSFQIGLQRDNCSSRSRTFRIQGLHTQQIRQHWAQCHKKVHSFLSRDSRKNLLISTHRTLVIISLSLMEGEVQPCKHRAIGVHGPLLSIFSILINSMMPMTKNWHHLLQEGRESVPAANLAVNKEVH